MARLPRQGKGDDDGKRPPAPVHSRLLCQFVASNGSRCRYPGSMSSDTTGQGDWFCGRHFRLPTSADEMQAADAVVAESLHKAPTLETAADIRGLAMACLRRRMEEQETIREARLLERQARKAAIAAELAAATPSP